MVTQIATKFEASLGTFYSAASAAISGYVLPIAWVMLGIALLVWCYAIMEGKVQSPLQDWIFKFISAMIVLYAISGGYLSLIADPLFDLGNQLSALVSGAGGKGTALSTISGLYDLIINLLSIIFETAGLAMKNLAFGTAIQLYLWGVIVAIATLLLMATALFFYIYAKLGISLVLAVGPFFVLGLINQHSRSYFFSWLNTALYFVFYQVLTVLFVVLFLSILTDYMTTLQTQLSGTSFSLVEGVANLVGLGSVQLNVAAAMIPIVIISIAMFFMLFQLPTIAASMTGGSGGAFGNGLYSMVMMMRGRGGKGGGGGGGGSAAPSKPAATPVMLPAPK